MAIIYLINLNQHIPIFTVIMVNTYIYNNILLMQRKAFILSNLQPCMHLKLFVFCFRINGMAFKRDGNIYPSQVCDKSLWCCLLSLQSSAANYLSWKGGGGTTRHVPQHGQHDQRMNGMITSTAGSSRKSPSKMIYIIICFCISGRE